MVKSFKILTLAGDGIGPEVIEEAKKILKAISETSGVKFEIEEEIAGGISIDKRGTPITDSVLRTALKSDAVLLGAVGGPKWDNLPMSKRPEQALLKLRYELKTWANIRPVKVLGPLVEISPLKPEVVSGTDMLILRELTGDVYFGEPRKKTKTYAVNTMKYTRKEVERIAHLAFKIARKRRKRITSVDKANILEVSSFWREIITDISKNYPDVALEHMLVDAFSMKMVLEPRSFDVVLTSNMFGDIISDEGGGILGSLGLLPSGSLGDGKRSIYEPVHGSAPDIAGKGVANPIATILSVTLMLRFSFDMDRSASLVEKAVESVLKKGFRTPDIASSSKHRIISTKKMGDMVVREVMGRGI